MFSILKKLRRDTSGATAIEYGLIAALVGIAIITGVGMAGESLDTMFQEIGGKLTVSAGGGTE